MDIGLKEIENILQQHRDTFKSMGVRRLGLFGSFCRNQQTAASDLDFLVEFEKKSFDAYMDLKEFLENLFHRKVDLVTKESLKPILKPYILNEVRHVPGL